MPPQWGQNIVRGILTLLDHAGTDHTGIPGVGGGGGTPGGLDEQVQYNNAGAFGGDAGLLYDGGGNLTVGVGIAFPKEVDHTIAVEASTSDGVDGGDLTFSAGDGAVSAAGTGGIGGSLNLLAGDSGNGVTAGAPGSINITAGSAGTGGDVDGGPITIRSGEGVGTGVAGSINFYLGAQLVGSFIGNAGSGTANFPFSTITDMLIIPYNNAPGSPTNGEIWIDSGAQFNRVGGVTEEVMYV